ncbi:alpha/beta hydrolase [Salipiger bermudensis]|uniref:alpha/beta hydrolase n=1 Tax=Salipiger bermudensis TaxID=344736 RepID=UPI003515CD9C
MTPEQIIAAIGLLVSEPDPAFDTLRDGGFDARYPVSVEACPETTSPLDIEGHTLICGTVSVPENYDAPDGRRIPLEFALGRAHTTHPFPDAVVYLHGGPASGALGSIAAMTDVILGSHRAHRDVVSFDQRAAMLSSTTVRCRGVMAENIVGLVRSGAGKPAIEGEEVSDETVFGPCIEELYASEADLPAYNTANNARDVRAVMSALGYPEYNIFGISYGTRLALEVLRTAPEGVRAVIIDGVAPTGVKLYDDLFGPHADALEAMFDQCAAQPACAEAYPDLRQKTVDLGGKLTETPIPAARGQIEIDATRFYNLINQRTHHSALWARELTAYLPRMIYELSDGNAATLDWYLDTHIDPRAKEPADLLGRVPSA